MGIDYDELRSINAALIYMSISGFGAAGPYSQKRVYDPIIQATGPWIDGALMDVRYFCEAHVRLARSGSLRSGIDPGIHTPHIHVLAHTHMYLLGRHAQIHARLHERTDARHRQMSTIDRG